MTKKHTLTEADLVTRRRTVSPATRIARCALARALERRARPAQRLELSRALETREPDMAAACAHCLLFEAAE